VDASEIFVGRQPIVDRRQKLIAFELLFRAGHTATGMVNDDMRATASVIANSFGEIGLDKVLDGHRAFINFSRQMLMSDLVDILPPDKVVLEILETVDVGDQEILERLFELKQRGFKLALDDVITAGPDLNAVRGVVDIIKLDLQRIAPATLPALVMQFKLWPVRVLAEKIDSQEQGQRCLELGIDMFQGYYFARPEIISGRRLDPARAALLRLLAMVLSDASDLQIEAELKRHPQLIFNLLCIVNSVAYGTGKKVTSLRDCLVILGRRHLQRWIQLLLYAGPDKDMAGNALLHTAATRARLMETLTQCATRPNGEAQDRAFMVGILSLLDVLWQIPMTDIVKQLPIEPRVAEALTSRCGWEGKLLSLIESKEANDVEAVESAFRGLQGITLKDLIQADFEAMIWANQLSTT